MPLSEHIPKSDDGEALDVNITAQVSTTPSFVSTLNSSSVPLGISEIFTGSVEELTNYALISVFVYSDQSSATDGLIVEYSTDGINFDDTDSFSITNLGTKIFTFGAISRYFRIRYINGTTPQGVFRLQTILHTQSIKSSTHKIGSVLSTENDAELVLSVLSGKDLIDGSFKNVGVSNNRLLVSQETATPSGAIKVSRQLDQVVAASVDDVYTITNGKTLTLQTLSAGAQNSGNGGIVEVHYDPLGTGSGLTLLGKIFVNGSTNTISITDSFVGDGTKAIRLRLRDLTTGSNEMNGKWIGFEV